LALPGAPAFDDPIVVVRPFEVPADPFALRLRIGRNRVQVTRPFRIAGSHLHDELRVIQTHRPEGVRATFDVMIVLHPDATAALNFANASSAGICSSVNCMLNFSSTAKTICMCFSESHASSEARVAAGVTGRPRTV